MVEIMVVITIISIMSMVAVPRISGFFSNKRENLAVFTGIAVKTFDDSFLHEKINYLVIHLSSGSVGSDDALSSSSKDIFSRGNGLSVVNLMDGAFQDNPRKLFRYKHFNDSFRVEEVVLSSGEIIQSGNVLIPFYPQGYSDNVIVHILVNNEEKISVRIFRHLKEPRVYPGYITFQETY